MMLSKEEKDLIRSLQNNEQLNFAINFYKKTGNTCCINAHKENEEIGLPVDSEVGLLISLVKATLQK